MTCEICGREVWRHDNTEHERHRYDDTYCGGGRDTAHWCLGYEREKAARLAAEAERDANRGGMDGWRLSAEGWQTYAEKAEARVVELERLCALHRTAVDEGNKVRARVAELEALLREARPYTRNGVLCDAFTLQARIDAAIAPKPQDAPPVDCVECGVAPRFHYGSERRCPGLRKSTVYKPQDAPPSAPEGSDAELRAWAANGSVAAQREIEERTPPPIAPDGMRHPLGFEPAELLALRERVRLLEVQRDDAERLCGEAIAAGAAATARWKSAEEALRGLIVWAGGEGIRATPPWDRAIAILRRPPQPPPPDSAKQE